VALLSARREGNEWKGIRSDGDDAFKLAIEYVKQETIEPLQGAGRYVVYGVAGSLAISIGVVLLLVAVLRILQTETGAFHGNLSWIPYLIVAVLGLAVIGLAAWRVTAGPAARRRPAGSSGPGEGAK
jgi:hypothetical protein